MVISHKPSVSILENMQNQQVPFVRLNSPGLGTTGNNESDRAVSAVLDAEAIIPNYTKLIRLRSELFALFESL